MRIDGPRPPVSPPALRPGRANNASPSAPPAAGGQVGEARAAGGPQVLVSVASVLAAQHVEAVEDASGRRRRAVRRATRLLDALDELRRGLLDGAVPADLPARLGQLLAEEVGDVEESELAVLLAEIERRAAVETAKLERLLEEGGDMR